MIFPAGTEARGHNCHAVRIEVAFGSGDRGEMMMSGGTGAAAPPAAAVVAIKVAVAAATEIAEHGQP